MSVASRVLCVVPDDERSAFAATDRPFVVERTRTMTRALDHLARESVDCVLSAQSLPDGSGVELLRRVRRRHGSVPFVLCPETSDPDVASEAVHYDVTEYVPGGVTVATERAFDRVETALERDHNGEHRTADVLADLLTSTRRLMDADSQEAIAEITTTAARDVLGFDINAVRLYDGERDVLVPAATTPRTREIMPERPLYASDEGFPGQAFTSGEPVIVTDARDPSHGHDISPVKAGMYLPIGEYGTLSIGSLTLGEYDDQEVNLAKILAANAEAALARVDRQAELGRYEMVLETVQDYVYALDAEGRFIMVTDPLADLVGYDRSELLGSTPAMLLDEAELAAGEDIIRHLLANPEDDPGTYQVELSTPGGPIPAKVSISLLPFDDGFDGSVGVVRDISDLVEAEAELATARDRFTYLFEHVPDAVVEVERDGDSLLVCSTNPIFEDLFGPDDGSTEGVPLSGVVRAAEDEDVDVLSKVAAGAAVDVERRLHTNAGLRSFIVRSVPYHVEGDDVRTFCLFVDITDQKQRERRLQVLHTALRHNLRNEMNLIMGDAEQIRRSTEFQPIESRADALRERAREITALSDKARQLEQAVEETTMLELDLVDVVDTVLAEFADDATVFETDVPAEARVWADTTLEMAVWNAVENAVEHGDRTPTTVEVGITPAEETEHGRVELTIRDDGPGIPEYEHEVVVGNRETTPLEHASGFGLWIITAAVQTVGGTVSFEPNEPRGTCVRISLQPASEAPDEVEGATL